MASLALVMANIGMAANPLVPNIGMADPHVHVFDDSFYMFATHDFSANNTGFLMKDWWVWKSTDLVHWTQDSVVHPAAVFNWSTPDEQRECWATDGAFKDGKYFFYLSVGPGKVAVLTAPSPAGPWEDPIGKPLLDKQVKGATFRDPAVLQDSDGKNYIIAGVFDYYIAALADDMVSLGEPLRKVEVNNALGTFGPGKTDDKPFLHKYNGTYYLSWGCFYGTSSSPYGPYTYQGSAIMTDSIAANFRMPPDTPKPWYQWQDLKDRHGSFWTMHGQWYFASNDRSHSGDVKNPGVYRDTVVGYIHYRANGSIVPAVIDAHGVGNYDACGWIEAENFFKLLGHGHKEEIACDYGPGFGFAIAGLSNGSQLHYPFTRNINFDGTGSKTLAILLRAANAAAATVVRVRIVSHTTSAPVADAECVVPRTGGWSDFKKVICPLHVRSASAREGDLRVGSQDK